MIGRVLVSGRFLEFFFSHRNVMDGKLFTRHSCSVCMAVYKLSE
jgi:hypothetical protein